MLGTLTGIRWEWLNGPNNMTLGVHGQEWESEDEYQRIYTTNEVYLGLYFFRIVFEFTKI